MIGDSIKALAEKSKRDIKFKPGDYYGRGDVIQTDMFGQPFKDEHGKLLTDKGLLYCGKCHKPKQIGLFSSVTGIIEPCCLCTCGQKQDNSVQDDLIRRERDIEIQHNLSQADRLMLKNTFDHDRHPDSKAGKIARAYVRDWRKKNLPNNIGLYLYGDVGVGKTFYASCIANAIAHTFGDTVKALSITTALNELYSTSNKSGYISELAAYDLLILDDVGTERRTDYSIEQVFSILDERYKAQKPLIITSNRDYSALKTADSLGMKRICDRVLDMCLPFKITGVSQRGIQNRLR